MRISLVSFISGFGVYSHGFLSFIPRRTWRTHGELVELGITRSVLCYDSFFFFFLFLSLLSFMSFVLVGHDYGVHKDYGFFVFGGRLIYLSGQGMEKVTFKIWVQVR